MLVFAASSGNLIRTTRFCISLRLLIIIFLISFADLNGKLLLNFIYLTHISRFFFGPFKF